jgi:transcriptional regulator with XRE-family HTH domain
MDNAKEPTSPFGRRLRELRKAKVLNQKQLADMVGLDFTYLSKIETGTMPPPTVETIGKLAEALHVPPDELILLAGKFPEDLRAVAGKTIMPDLLRAIKDSKISDEQLKALVELLKSCKPEQK